MYIINEYDYFKLNEEHYILVNYLSGACDILDKPLLMNFINRNFTLIDEKILMVLKQRKYIFDSKEDYEKYIIEINAQLKEESKFEEPNFLLIPTYRCNFACDYCFEGKYEMSSVKEVSEQWINLVFEAMKKIVNIYNVNNKKTVEVTLMGGEPLMQSNYKVINKIVKKLKTDGYSYNIITNGYEIDKFVDIFKEYKPDCVQITLDGPKKVHNCRRVLKNGSGTFDKIISNIQLCLNLDIKTFVRVNVDENNLDYIPELADCLKKLENQELLIPYIYPLQDGGCIGDHRIIDEKKIIEKINIIKEKHDLNIFDLRFHGYNFINSILSNCKFNLCYKNCSACGKQFIFDEYGDVYKCWFGIGQKKFKIGEFIPELNLFDNKISMWSNRNIENLEKCNECKYRYICGGGCVSHILKESDTQIGERCIDYKEIIKEQLKMRIGK